MIVRLLPEQVSKFWPIVKYAIEQSLPPVAGEGPEKMNSILSAALSGSLDVWASYKRSDDQVQLDAIVVTKLLSDNISGINSLLIYCLYGYEKISDDNWKEGFEALATFAKDNKCSRIVAYSSAPVVVEWAKRLGANTEYTFISFNL